MNMTMFLLAIIVFVFSTKSVSSRKCVEEILYCGDPVSGIFKIGNFPCCYKAEHAGALKFLSGKLYICLGNKWATFEFEKLFVHGTEFNPGFSCKDIQDRAGKRLSDGIYWIRLRGGQTVFPVYCDMAGGGERLRQTQATEPTVGRYDKIDAHQIKALKTAVGWTMVFKALSNLTQNSNPFAVYDSHIPTAEYVLAALANTGNHRSHYKNRVATKRAWGAFDPTEASEKGPSNWYSAATLINSSWSDLKTETTNSFQIEPFCQYSSNCRVFLINRQGTDCRDAEGWVMFPMDQFCTWNTTFPVGHFMYSKGDTYARWSDENKTEVADVLAVFLI
ncbi:uncharacterized protein LOC114962382 isoform X2 [Acropora millepora]|uniref:uncharacterized protein LOC114962382 isoform X2 n=1 Tax=Acropora millepora TaxID=45264 RepID=UPI001CF26D3D|nr:uncharacterized protein LOC114962382 isoform X2 [Acropora millepora]